MADMIRRGECKNCPNEKVYLLIEQSTVLSATRETVLRKLDGKVKSNSQCSPSIRKSLNKKKYLVEVCRPIKLKTEDIQFVTNKSLILNEQEASDYIANNITDWEVAPE